MKRSAILWIGALALGWLFDLLFWKQGVGINFAIFAVLCLGVGLLVLVLNGHKPSWKSLLLLVPILFFAAMTFMRMEPLSMFLGYVFTLFLMSVLVQSYLGGRWMQYSLSDYVANQFKMLGGMVARPVMFLAERRKLQPAVETTSGTRRNWKRAWAVGRGLLIALPIIVILAALLASADLIFAARLKDFVQLFRLEKLPEYLFRLVYILIGAYLLSGLFLHAAYKSQNEKLIGEDRPVVGQFLGFTEAAVVLGAVNLLFLLFVFIQFRYFFGGQANISLEGYTYSEYARRGFGELVAVAFISLVLFLSLSAVTKRESVTQRRVFSGLGVLLVVLIGVMLFSAFQRLMLYEAAYGFSRLRTYTHIFMIWLSVLLAVVVVLDILRKERAFALAALLAAIGFAATLSLINVDGFIVRQNVARAAAGESLDVPYLASLSSDAVPALARQFRDQKLPAATRDAVGAALVCYEQVHAHGRDFGWRGFLLTRWQAEKALGQLRTQLDAYQVQDTDYPIKLLTPMSIYYECYPGAGD